MKEELTHPANRPPYGFSLIFKAGFVDILQSTDNIPCFDPTSNT
jgi:hypothetical protein